MASGAPFQISSSSAWHVRRCASVLRRGGVIAYPTEGVWGLGCDPWNESAVQRLLQLKQRQQAKGLILISGNAAHFDDLLASLPPGKQAEMQMPRKRATTWLVPDTGNYFPACLKGAHATVALRVSTHPLVRALTEQLGYPIVSTSANVSGHPAAHNALRVHQYFGTRLDDLLPGQTGQETQASQIIDLMSGVVIRR